MSTGARSTLPDLALCRGGLFAPGDLVLHGMANGDDDARALVLSAPRSGRVLVYGLATSPKGYRGVRAVDPGNLVLLARAGWAWEADKPLEVFLCRCGLLGQHLCDYNMNPPELVGLYDAQGQWIADVLDTASPPIGTEINGRAVQFVREPMNEARR